jgi:hypothetical protein
MPQSPASLHDVDPGFERQRQNDNRRESRSPPESSHCPGDVTQERFQTDAGPLVSYAFLHLLNSTCIHERIPPGGLGVLSGLNIALREFFDVRPQFVVQIPFHCGSAEEVSPEVPDLSRQPHQLSLVRSRT